MVEMSILLLILMLLNPVYPEVFLYQATASLFTNHPKSILLDLVIGAM